MLVHRGALQPLPSQGREKRRLPASPPPSIIVLQKAKKDSPPGGFTEKGCSYDSRPSLVMALESFSENWGVLKAGVRASDSLEAAVNASGERDLCMGLLGRGAWLLGVRACAAGGDGGQHAAVALCWRAAEAAVWCHAHGRFGHACWVALLRGWWGLYWKHASWQKEGASCLGGWSGKDACNCHA